MTPRPDRPPIPAGMLDILNAMPGHDRELGITFTEASYDGMVATLEVGPRHLQPYGLVHGGVYATMVEAVASTSAAVHALADGNHTVGLENSTSFLRAVREGTLTARARAETIGRRTQVWTVEVRDDAGRLAATGKVRMLVVEGGAAIAGETVAVGG